MEMNPGSKGKEIGSKDPKRMAGMDEYLRWTAQAVEPPRYYMQHGQRACIRTSETKEDGGDVLRTLERSCSSPPVDVAAKQMSRSIGNETV